jgi:hypothetical protein
MNKPEDREQLEDLVLRYLYGDLDNAERTSFERALSDNRQLQEILLREQALEHAIPLGTSVHIDDGRLEDNRHRMHRNLQRQVANRSPVSAFLQALIRKPSLMALQSAARAASFVLGILIDGSGGDGSAGNSPQSGVSPLALIGEQDYEISAMQVDRFDPLSGDIDLSFSMASETRMSGNVSDVGIRTLMTVALLNEIDEAARLDAIEVLQNASYTDEVSSSIIYVLNNDSNPGVRYSAVRSLVDYVEIEPVRNALRNALQDDVNPGVRVEAFNALARNPDSETLAVFRQRAEVDGNDYIRQRAREIIENPGNGVNNSEFF